MTPEPGSGLTTLSWGNEQLTVYLSTGPDDAPRLLGLALPGDPAPFVRRSALPLVDVALAGEGRMGTAGKRHVDGAASQRLRLVWDKQGDGSIPGQVQDSGWLTGPWWQIAMSDAVTGLEIITTLSFPGNGAVMRIESMVAATTQTVTIEHISSFILGGLAAGTMWENDMELWSAANPWSGEFRWKKATLGEAGLFDVGMTRFNQVGTKNRVALTSTGAWATSEHLPMGVLEDRNSGRLMAWQIETNGAWHWEVADRYDDVYVNASGPTALEHAWAATLEPGETFSPVPASVTLAQSPRHQLPEPTSRAVGRDGGADAVGSSLTTYRRAIRRPHPDNVELPVIYNDFLNGLMADPTTDRVIPLVEAAAAIGVDIYCMDAGWYDDEQGGWWDSVGEWKASNQRFPNGGLGQVMRSIHDAGMRPGLWIEPEVVGKRSPLAESLPADAFFRRHGHRVSEWGRYQLDFRHPAARTHLNEVVDRLVEDYGLGYLKIDYNIDSGAGTTGPAGTETSGAGLLGHARALLDWVSDTMDRHPGLVIEGCAAGGSRSDTSSGSVFPIQSLTDQQDMLLLPPISAAAPMAITPEQSGVWASLDGSMSDEMIAFTLAAPLAARFHLAGRIDTLSAAQRALVRETLGTYAGLKQFVREGTPTWPLGLPGWRDDWIVQGLKKGDSTLLVVHRRGGADSCSIPVQAEGRHPTVETLFPTSVPGEAELTHDEAGTVLAVRIPAAPAARVYRINASNGVKA